MELSHSAKQDQPSSLLAWQTPTAAARTSVVVAHSSYLIAAGIASTLRSLPGCDVRLWGESGGPQLQLQPQPQPQVQPQPRLTLVNQTRRCEPVVHTLQLLIGDAVQVARALAEECSASAVVLVTSDTDTDSVEALGLCDGDVAAYLPVTSRAAELVETVRRLSEASHPAARIIRPPSFARGGLAPGALRRVREHIEARLAEKIELHTLASIAGLSECHFSRAFKQSLGLPPHRYLLQLRCKVAADLIRSGDSPLAEVCLTVGFSDQSHFTRTFLHFLGETPGAFRRRHR